MARKTKRLTRRDWLQAAYRALAREGERGVRVEVLARELGVTKGSFYWHFADREELRESLLQHWYESMTGRVMGEASRLRQSPQERLRFLMATISKRRLNRYDAAVRSWARYDKEVARRVRMVDVRRLDYVRSLFEEMGFEGIEAEMRARLVVHHQYAEELFLVKEDRADRDALARARHRLLTAGAPKAKARPKRKRK